MTACDIDKLRDLVIRQDRAKNEQHYLNAYMGLDSLAVERQLNTYLAQGTTVAELTKCVEALEAEAKKRINRQLEMVIERDRQARLLRLCRNCVEMWKYVPDKTKAGELRYMGSPENDCRIVQDEIEAKESK